MSPFVFAPLTHLTRFAVPSGRSRCAALSLLGVTAALTWGCSSETGEEAPGGVAGSSSPAGTSSGGTSTGGGASGGGTSNGGNASGGGSGTGTGTSGAGSGSGGGANNGGTNGGGAGGSNGGAGGVGGGGTSGGGVSGGGMGGSAGAGGADGTHKSAGCMKAPASLKSATVNQATPVNTIMVDGKSRQFLTRWPSSYDNGKAYPLHVGLHGANGNLSENGRDNFGLWALAKDSTIFVTLAASGGLWSGASDLVYADAVLKQVESELCIDTSKVVLEGFSQGAAMSWFLTGSRPGVFRAVVGHSGGGVQGIPMLSSVPYLGSLGTGESGNGQNTQTDQFAKANGCTVEMLPTAQSGQHVCTAYKGCKEGFPVTWCSYDGGHGFQDTDAGTNTSWVPSTVWDFLKPLLF